VTEIADEPLDESTLDERTVAALKKLRSEAKGLRDRMHVKDEEIGRLSAQLLAHQRADAERIASEQLLDGTDLWRHASEETQQQFVDEQFAEVIPDAVRDAAAAIVEARPHLGRPATAPPPTDRPVEGLRSGALPETKPPSAPTWAGAIRGY
jgi:hypothetical protein